MDLEKSWSGRNAGRVYPAVIILIEEPNGYFPAARRDFEKRFERRTDDAIEQRGKR